MTLRRSIRTVVAVVGLARLGFAASARAADVPTHVVAANVNDAGIDTTARVEPRLARARPGAAGREAARVHGRRGRDQPAAEWSEIGSEGGRLGYHTIVLAYRNEAPVAALPPVGCGNSVDPPASPPNCAFNARMEILDGRGRIDRRQRRSRRTASRTG